MSWRLWEHFLATNMTFYSETDCKFSYKRRVKCCLYLTQTTTVLVFEGKKFCVGKACT